MQRPRPSCLVLASILIAKSLSAQAVTGSISGTIIDPSGAAVGGVQIEITNLETELRRTAANLDNGTYTVAQLPPGTYDVLIQKPGFANQVQRGVRLLVKSKPDSRFQALTFVCIPEYRGHSGSPGPRDYFRNFGESCGA